MHVKKNLDEFLAKNIIHLDTKEHLTDEHNICITCVVQNKIRATTIFWNLMYKVDLSTLSSILKASKLFKTYQDPEVFFEGYISSLIDKYIELEKTDGIEDTNYFEISDRINDFISKNLLESYGLRAHFRIVSIYMTCKKAYAC